VNSKVNRAEKELKGFRKVFVEMNKSEKIGIEIPVKDLSYYNEIDSNWVIEKGDYFIYVGNASNNIFEKILITIT
jgi:beta-glucosidase